MKKLLSIVLLLVCPAIGGSASAQSSQPSGSNEALTKALAGGIKVGLNKLFGGTGAKARTVQYASPRRAGLELEIEKVAFAEPEGPCGESFRDLIRADFLHNGLQVVDRANLEALLAEHELSLSGIVSRDDALELGHILGPVALVFVNVRICDTTQDSERSLGRDSEGRQITHYKVTTTGIFRGTVEIVDLKTAQVHSAPAIEVNRDLTAQQWGTSPPYPSSYEAKSEALGRAVEEVNRLLFPWTEWLPFAFYDHGRCNLQLAYRLMQAQDWAGALSQSMRNVQECEGRPKYLAYANHNLGVAQFFAGESPLARATLNEALRLNASEATTAALLAMQKAEEAITELQAEATAEKPGDAPVRAQADRLAELQGLYEQELISLEIYQAKVNAAVSEDGAPGTTAEEKLRYLKELMEQGLITSEVYDKKMAEVLATL